MDTAELRSEAERAIGAGQVAEARNPANGLFEWTVDDVVDGIRADVVDGWSHGGPLRLFDGDPLIGRVPVRFLDRELGRRLAAATLEALDRTA